MKKITHCGTPLEFTMVRDDYKEARCCGRTYSEVIVEVLHKTRRSHGYSLGHCTLGIQGRNHIDRVYQANFHREHTIPEEIAA